LAFKNIGGRAALMVVVADHNRKQRLSTKNNGRTAMTTVVAAPNPKCRAATMDTKRIY
jgi:hypothetical protein